MGGYFDHYSNDEYSADQRYEDGLTLLALREWVGEPWGGVKSPEKVLHLSSPFVLMAVFFKLS